MKIAYVYDAVFPYRIGGVEKRIFELSHRLAARGHEIHIYGLKVWDDNSSFTRGGVSYHGIGKSRPFYTHGRRSIGEAVYFGWNMLSPLLRERFDIIDCQNFPYFSCFSSTIASRIKHSPLVITWHEVWGDYWYDYLGVLGFSGKIIEKMASRISENVVAVSNLTKNDLNSLNNHLEVKVISNGIDIQKINSVNTSDMISDIIFSGRLVREKKADLLVRAVAIIRKEFPDIRVVIVGDGPEKDGLQKLTKQCDVEKNIRFIGFTPGNEELIATMKSSKIFASPSIREGFGMAAIEALACGLPVVTSNARKNAVKELIGATTGIVCAVNPEVFAEALLEALERRDLMTMDCKNNAQQYDWGRIVMEVEEYYENIRYET
jgi:L-malate glycosyltransferase